MQEEAKSDTGLAVSLCDASGYHSGRCREQMPNPRGHKDDCEERCRQVASDLPAVVPYLHTTGVAVLDMPHR
jgi:hypothetical protein